MGDKQAIRFGHKSLAGKGFSLVELLVVCALISIMVSLSIPALRDSLFSDPLKSTARKTIGLVNGVRELALRTQQPYFLYINRLENRLWYDRDLKTEDGEHEVTGHLRIPKSVRIEEIILAGKDVTAMEQVAVWITRQGYMHETSIGFADDAGHTLTLKFLPFVDSVQITDPQTRVVQ
ncbi:MAG: prepilin-type N-terminal cleavage/methylation domain-containing protein [Proteobacteria bacterium]|nr:prepilin-type N-terminal cleavage/methylation domain-containing protein [Pseudomonadota bacterium]